MKTKFCKKCGITKKVCEFQKRKGSKDGYRNDCKSCNKLYHSCYRKKNFNSKDDDFYLLNNKKKKECNLCGIEKQLSEFYPDKTKKTGYGSMCRKCHNKISKNYREENPEKIKILADEWRLNNPEKIKAIQERSYKKNYEKNKPKLNQWRKNNPEKVRQISRDYRINNPEKTKATKKRAREKIRLNPVSKLSKSIRSRLSSSLKRQNITKKNNTFNIIDCSPKDLKEHLEKQFKPGMTWENRGLYGWHIDHIIPLAFAKTEEDIYKLWHYSNLQPLWAGENYKKGSKIL